MKSIIFLFCFVLSLVWMSSVFADDNSCWLQAPSQDDIWVIVYDADADGNRGDIIWQGKIAAGQKIEVVSTDGHIRYQYKRDKDQPYEGDIADGCYQENNIQID